MINNTARVAILAATLCGCAAQQHYIPPESTTNPVATLRLVNESHVQAFFRTFDNEECERGPNSGVMAILQGGWQIYDNKTKAETVIRGDRPFVFTVDGHGYGLVTMNCVVAATFIPEPGAVYTMEYKFRRGCTVDVVRAVDGGGQEPVQLTSRSDSCLKYGV